VCTEEKRLFLKFATGSDRAPINGLAHMNFVISRNGDDGDRLPTAHTCFNHLLLPNYGTIEKLRDRLKLAITQSEGFGLR
jgi:ubiquitin-protein ligase E3 A